jgi:DNA mismatch endonuclease, patch repair protein
MTGPVREADCRQRRGPYLRDGRAPIPAQPSTSEVMRANRARLTGPELALQNQLKSAGVTGFRTNYSDLPGRPDIAFPKNQLAVFVHGCFWHRCPHCALPLPRTHTEFWAAKFARNRVRDARKARALRREGWSVVTIWECQIRDKPARIAVRITRGLHNRPIATRPRGHAVP